jgi:hypothetical protein
VPKWKPAHGGYRVRTSAGELIRPNKVARGMTATSARSAHRLADDALTLAVRGTTATDPLRFKVEYYDGPPCACCGASRPMPRLADRGRLRLRILRERRAARLATRAASVSGEKTETA